MSFLPELSSFDLGLDESDKLLSAEDSSVCDAKSGFFGLKHSIFVGAIF